MLDPKSFFRATVLVHESARHSLDPVDKGNWFKGKLVGSKYGVTGAALSHFRNGRDVTIVDMDKLTEDEALNLGLANYYKVQGLDLLPWDRVIASVVDHGFNAGPKRAVEILQKLIGAPVDGAAGPTTKRLYKEWRARAGSEENAARLWADARIAYYTSLRNPKYIKGWTNRTKSFLPNTAWWKANA